MSLPPGPAWRFAAFLSAVSLLALVVRAAGLGSQPLIGDDVSVGQTALNFVEMGLPSPTMWNHPRLRDLLVYLSLGAFGDGPWGLKAWSVLFGALSVPATAWLAVEATGSRAAAGIAALLVAVDPLHLDFSRQGINDVYLAFFPVAATAAILRYQAVRRPAWLAAAGILLGLGIASKWSAAFPVLAAGALVLGSSLERLPSARDRAAEVALFAACLGALSAATYLVTFWPWFGRGHDLAEWVRLQIVMARETSTHTGYPGTKLPGYPGELTSAWRWFVAPVWFVDYIPPMPGRGLPPEGLFVSGVSNALAWLATLPAAGFAAWRWRRAGDAGAGWLSLLFLAAYLPFLVVSRPIWTNSSLAVLPFGMALVGWAAARVRDRAPRLVSLWAGAAVIFAALLWLPAAGVSTRPTDAFLRALVSARALDPASHAQP